MRRLTLISLLIACAACSSSGKTGIGSNSGNSKNPPAKDVTVTNCVGDSSVGSATAKVTIVNHSSKRSNYTLEVNFLDKSGAQIGSGLGSMNNVEPGSTAKTEAVDFVQGKVARCELKNVERFAS